jgi:3-dehydrotetronate 4-kinase
MGMLGCIADDFTGATDIGALLTRSGLRVALIIGVPVDHAVPPDVDAIVVALKSRTIEPELAVEQSLAAARWLKAAGADTLYFKYCSTFDSTDRGSIGVRIISSSIRHFRKMAGPFTMDICSLVDG